jgi:hypothetical protein
LCGGRRGWGIDGEGWASGLSTGRRVGRYAPSGVRATAAFGGQWPLSNFHLTAALLSPPQPRIHLPSRLPACPPRLTPYELPPPSNAVLAPVAKCTRCKMHPLAPVGKTAPVGTGTRWHPLAKGTHAEWRRIREKPPAQNGDKERGGLGLTPRPAGTRGAQPGVSSLISLRLTWNMEAPGGFSTTRAPWAVADKMGNSNRFTGSSIVATFGYGSSGRIFPPPPLSELLGR